MINQTKRFLRGFPGAGRTGVQVGPVCAVSKYKITELPKTAVSCGADECGSRNRDFNHGQ